MKVFFHLLLIVLFSAQIVSASPKIGKIASRDYAASSIQGKTKNIHLTVQCDISSLEGGIVQEDGFDFYKIDGFDQGAIEPGDPVLPSSIIRVLIPEGYKFHKIKKVSRLTQVSKPVSNVFPKQKVSRTGDTKAPPFVTLKTREDGQRKSIEYVHTAKIRNHRMALFRYSPVRFKSSGKGSGESGTFTITGSLEFSVVFSPEKSSERAQVSQTYKRSNSEAIIDSYISDSVVNPEDLEETTTTVSALASDSDSTSCDYLIITATDLVDEFQVLADHREAMGLTTDIVTVDDIETDYAGDGSTQQIRIKQCILDYAENKGTLWVVLGGDDTIVPDQNCYGNVNYGGTVDKTIPTDLYYAGLDDMNWDDDGDGTPCEIEHDGDTIDLYPDVFVGRAPVRTEADAQAFVSKTIAYETAVYDPYFHEAALFMGVKLWGYDNDGKSDAQVKSEKLWDNAHDSRLSALPADKYRFYDTGTDFDGGADYVVNQANMSEQLNSGYGILWAATHGNYKLFGLESGSFSSSTAEDLGNENQGIVYTMACNTNGFDAEPGLSEAFIRNSDGGAVAYIGSSRYGWGYDLISLLGPSMKYAEAFFKMLYDEDLLSSSGGSADPALFGRRIGAVFASHKMDKISDSSSYNPMRWLQFSLNLMGDPFTKVMVKLPQDSDLDTDIDGEDIVAFINKTSTIPPDLWELAQRFGGSYSQ